MLYEVITRSKNSGKKLIEHLCISEYKTRDHKNWCHAKTKWHQR